MSRSTSRPFRTQATPLIAILPLVLGLCACTGSGGDNLQGAGGDSCGAVTGAGPEAGSASAHGQPDRAESDVTVSQENGKFVARRTITLSNDFGGAGAADVTLDMANGNVTTCRRNGGYLFKVYAYARGASEQEARDNLDMVTVSHSDALAAGTLTLDTSASLPATGTGGLPLPLPGTGVTTSSVEWGASIVAGLPVNANYALDLGTSNGIVAALGFSGSSATLDTSNGELELDGRWDDASLDTSNGDVVADGDFAGLDATTTNGGIFARLASTRSADVTLDASNGEIEARIVRSSNAGYDLSADTTNSEVSIDVAGTQPVGSQSDTSQHYQTPDYDSRSVQISVDASTTNGWVAIHD